MDTEKGYVILDVRTEEEYAEGHIEGAILIPNDEIKEKAGSILADKDQLILVYCRSGRRTCKARIYKRQGIRRHYRLDIRNSQISKTARM